MRLRRLLRGIGFCWWRVLLVWRRRLGWSGWMW